MAAVVNREGAAGDGGRTSGLSPQAMDTLRSLDSLSYGLLDLQGKAQAGTGGVGGGTAAARERVPVTRDLIKQGISHLRGSVAKLSHSPHSQAQIISLIGHLHLLLNEFTFSYSAYCQYRRLSPSSESDPALFYGLGIIHRCHGQHKQSEEAYRKVLALSPSFPRSGEVHLQLGLILKRRKAYTEAVAQFEKALSKTDPLLDKFMIQFHLAHISELSGQLSQAKNKYEVLLNCRAISTTVKACTQKQLGWLLHKWPEVCGGEGGAEQEDKSVREKALELLRQAAQAMPECGETWYLLGRVLVTHHKCHEAFAAYQRTIRYPSKISPANAWHSIGHLYFQMKQPRDSLQAYLCCVYLDPAHFQGWKSLGCLYEAVVHPTEALICYQNAMVASTKKGLKAGKDANYVGDRIEALSQYLSVIDVKSLGQNPGMPTLHEAWTTLVPLHIRNKNPNPDTPILTLNQSTISLHCHQTSSCTLPPLYPPLSNTLTPAMLSGSANGNFHIPMSSETDSLQNGNMSVGTPVCGQNGIGHRVTPGNEDMSLSAINLDSIDLAAVTSSIPSPASLSARSRVTVSSFTHSHPPEDTHTPSLSDSAPTPLSVTQPSSLQSAWSAQLQHQPPLLPPLTLSSRSTQLPGNPPGSHFRSGSHVTDMVWNQESVGGSVNWPSYLSGGRSRQILPPFHQQHTASSTASSSLQTPLTLPSPTYTQPPVAIPPRSLSLTENTANKKLAAPSRKRKSSSSSKSKTRRLSLSVGANSHPTPLLAAQPSFAGAEMVRVKTESNGVGGLTPLPTNMASDPALLSHIQAAVSCVNSPAQIEASSNNTTFNFNRTLSQGSSSGYPSYFGQSGCPGESVRGEGSSRKKQRLSSSDSHSSKMAAGGSEAQASLAQAPAHYHTHKPQPSAASASLPTPVSPSASSHQPPLPPPSSSSSADNLVDQLLEALQERDVCVGMANSPSESSSGISSAGTSTSTFFATAESSPVDPHSLTTSSTPLSPSLVPSFPPALPPSPPHSDDRLTRDEPQWSLSGTSPRGGLDHKTAKTEPLFDRNCLPRNGENIEKSEDSELLAPRVPFPSLAPLQEYMVLDPELRPPNPPPFHPGMELRPDCPIYKMSTNEDVESWNLLEFCNNPSNPICIIKGLVEAVGLDLSLFSSQCLVDTCANHEMEVREQMKQAADENCDVVSGRQVWKCESSKSVTTVAEYAAYQEKMVQREREEGYSGAVERVTDVDNKGEREFLSFGTNVDISDETIWHHQLQELNKLPTFLRVRSRETNLLSHIGHTVLGMNSVQLYMKVAGSRTPGHQENNNFCSLNINIGPGTCEWFAVPNAYWGMLHSLCEKHKVNFLVGSWWPVLEELHHHKVPVYRFTQHKGEVVFINPGTIHWVQANSVCNNIAWNTGPLTAHQFRMAWERYQWNKIQKVRSIVPMVHLTWNLARHVRLHDSHFYWQVRSLLESSLAQTNLLLSHLIKAGIPVLWHGKMEGEPAPYCNNCVEEVFNVLFVLSHKGEYLVYCHRCASSMKKTFTVLQQYQTEELNEVLAKFSLHLPDL